jgi:GxxExxY protein
MTIKYKRPPVPRSQDEFNAIDYQVMRQAFDLHNTIGNLWDEKDYQQKLSSACASQGLEVFEEVELSVGHNGFEKNYFIDLLIKGNIYELKTASGISEKHEAQTLGYIFLAGTHHGKIINFRSDSLTWRFVSTSLTPKDRRNYSLETTDWHPATDSGRKIQQIMDGLLSDWGAYLPTNLYKEALCHFLEVPLKNEHQRFITLSPETTIHISSVTKSKNILRGNLQKHLDQSSFNELLWINLRQNKIEFSSLHHSAQKLFCRSQ